MIQVRASGICGTDLHIYRGEYMGGYPVIPGHEFSGVVVAAGSQVTRFKAGDRVAVEPNISCDNCVNCLNNRQNFCLNWQAIGVTLPGGMEEYVIAPEKAVFSIGNLPFEYGAFMETLSCVVHGIERARIGPADHVAILGAGPIGNLMIQMARLQGAARITVLESNPGRAESARLDKVKMDGIKQKGCGLPITSILKEAEAPAVMKNSCILGGYCRVVGIDWSVLEEVLQKHIPKKLELNLLVARAGYDQAVQLCRIDSPVGMQANRPLPILAGNQAISLGLIKAGLGAYVAYPMTPSSSVLDFMARQAGQFGLKVVHPENEIAVMLMAEGFAYAGVKAAVGTSGGGFCLMTEGLSLSET